MEMLGIDEQKFRDVNSDVKEQLEQDADADLLTLIKHALGDEKWYTASGLSTATAATTAFLWNEINQIVPISKINAFLKEIVEFVKSSKEKVISAIKIGGIPFAALIAYLLPEWIKFSSMRFGNEQHFILKNMSKYGLKMSESGKGSLEEFISKSYEKLGSTSAVLSIAISNNRVKILSSAIGLTGGELEKITNTLSNIYYNLEMQGKENFMKNLAYNSPGFTNLEEVLDYNKVGIRTIIDEKSLSGSFLKPPLHLTVLDLRALTRLQFDEGINSLDNHKILNI